MAQTHETLELEKKHKRGSRTFTYIFVQKAWWLALLGIGFLYLAWAVYWGNLNSQTTALLLSHPSLYITVGMLAEWSLLVGIAFLLVGYLRASVFYRMFKFILDEYAVHLRRGLFYIRETTIPYHQISNVHIGRPYHYRMLGLAQLDIVTAADRSDSREERGTKKFLMPIIDLSVARTLSRQLLEYASRSRKNEPIDDESEEDEEESDEGAE